MYKNIVINENHEFVINVPSATRLVNEIYPFDASEIPEKYLIMGQDKGNCVHHAIEMFLKWNVKIECEHEVETHRKHFDNFIKWWSKYKNELSENIKIFTELPLTNDTTKGIIDCVIWDKDNSIIYVIDWKTTKDKHPDKENLQTYIYQELVKDNLNELIPELVGKEYKYKRVILNTNSQKEYELVDDLIAENELREAIKSYYGEQLY